MNFVVYGICVVKGVWNEVCGEWCEVFSVCG